MIPPDAHYSVYLSPPFKNWCKPESNSHCEHWENWHCTVIDLASKQGEGYEGRGMGKTPEEALKKALEAMELHKRKKLIDTRTSKDGSYQPIRGFKL